MKDESYMYVIQITQLSFYSKRTNKRKFSILYKNTENIVINLEWSACRSEVVVYAC